MPRRSKKSKNSVKLGVERLKRKCRYCKTHQNGRGFEKHEAWCKKTSAIRQELQELQDLGTPTIGDQLRVEVVPPKMPSSLVNAGIGEEFVEGPSYMPMDAGYSLSDHLSNLGIGTLMAL